MAVGMTVGGGPGQVFLPTIMELLGRRQAERLTPQDSMAEEDLLPCERKERERENSGSIPLMLGQV